MIAYLLPHLQDFFISILWIVITRPKMPNIDSYLGRR